MESSLKGKEAPVLLILAASAAMTWILFNASAGDWVFSDVCCVCGLAVFTVPFLGLVSAGALAYLAVRLFRRQLSLNAFLPLLVVTVGFFMGWNLPSKPAVVFWLHHDEFIELAEWAVAEHGDSPGYRLPPAAFYDDAIVYRDFSGATVVDFVIDNFYLPLVYISTDNPEDVYDTCSAGGIPVDRLEPHWYVCKRDWN